MTADPGQSAEVDEAFERARKRAEELQGLYIHLFVYVIVNVGLIVINWASTGGDGPWWFIWPLLGWGIGVLIHIVTTVIPVFSSDWVDRRAKRMAGRPPSGT